MRLALVSGVRLLPVVTFLAQGCGTSILASYPLDFPFLRANGESVIAQHALEDRVQTTRALIHTSPLRVACETTTVIPNVETTMVRSFEGVGRMWCGFMGVGEGLTATLLAVSRNTQGRDDQIGAVALGVDAAVAMTYAIFASSSHETWTQVGPGTPEVSQSCPDGLAVRAGGQTWAVTSDGSLTGDVRLLATAALAGQPIVLAGGGLERTWSPGGSERCALVSEFGLADSSGACAVHHPELASAPASAAPPPPSAASVSLPLEIQIRVHVPRPPR
jgi:hypothetical protein